ncbi:hypothetical protein C8J56DRAFT_964245 [Mycena floridula]|nr:hypothetical protein C8J56DRAFT_964245 [Mycena floridula]
MILFYVFLHCSFECFGAFVTSHCVLMVFSPLLLVLVVDCYLFSSVFLVQFRSLPHCHSFFLSLQYVFMLACPAFLIHSWFIDCFLPFLSLIATKF